MRAVWSCSNSSLLFLRFTPRDEPESSPARAGKRHCRTADDPAETLSVVAAPVETLDSPTETLDSPAEAPPGRSPEDAAVDDASAIAGWRNAMGLRNAMGKYANKPTLEPIATEGRLSLLSPTLPFQPRVWGGYGVRDAFYEKRKHRVICFFFE
jgi:hypothetical protein